MAQVGSGAVLVMNGVELSSYTKSVKTGGSADMLDCTPINTTGARTYQKGLTERSIAAEGFFKASANDVDNVDAVYRAALINTDSDDLILFGEEGSALGSPAIFGSVKESKYDISTIVGELMMTQFEAKATKSGSETLQPGVWMMKQVVTAATNGSTYDNGASSVGYVLQVHVIDGDDNCDVQLQHSTNGTVWADVAGAGPNVANNAAVQISDSSTSINRYRRVVATPASTTNTVAIAMKQSY